MSSTKETAQEAEEQQPRQEDEMPDALGEELAPHHKALRATVGGRIAILDVSAE